jgi:hypothetical protein
VARIVIDFDPAWVESGQLSGDSSDLVYFLSWAYATRYGASHELSIASRTIRDLGVNLQPLLTFADRRADDPADEEALVFAWQDAGPLADCCVAVTAVLASSTEESLQVLASEYPRLFHNIDELGQVAARAATRGAKIRLTYDLEDGA